MTLLPSGTQVYLAVGSTDMRKSINGLSSIVADDFELDPFSGHLFAFCNKSCKIIKILFWDKNGFCGYAELCITAKNWRFSGTPAGARAAPCSTALLKQQRPMDLRPMPTCVFFLRNCQPRQPMSWQICYQRNLRPKTWRYLMHPVEFN